MLTKRAAQQSLRKLSTQQQSLLRLSTTTLGLSTTRSYLQRRVASTTSQQEQLSIDQGYDILVKQRLKRPVSPNIGIYRPQITWYGSAFHRITGSVLSGAFYIFGFGYLVQPLIGYHIFESSSIIAAFAGMSLWAKVPIKFTAAFFLAFHSFNGLRHLSWDSVKMINNKKVIWTGWAAVGLSAVLSAWAAMM